MSKESEGDTNLGPIWEAATVGEDINPQERQATRKL